MNQKNTLGPHLLLCVTRLKMTLKLTKAHSPHLHPTVLISQFLARTWVRTPAITPIQNITMSSQTQQRGGSVQGGRGRGRLDDSNTKISKALSYILRHGAESEGLKLRGDGYANVAELVSSSVNPIEIVSLMEESNRWKCPDSRGST